MPTVSVYSVRQSGINCGQKITPHKRQSPCVRSFFIVRMLTLNRRFVKTFEDCINVNRRDAVDKENDFIKKNGMSKRCWVEIIVKICYNKNK